MLQLDLYGGVPAMLQSMPAEIPKARRADPATSHAAADEARELAQRHARIIVQCLKDSGPLGKDGIGARTQLTGVQIARRTVELERAGLIRWTGKTVKSTAGRGEREWEAV